MNNSNNFWDIHDPLVNDSFVYDINGVTVATACAILFDQIEG